VLRGVDGHALWAERLVQLGELASASLPDPLELLRATCRSTGASAAELVLFDGRSSRWATDPLRSLSAATRLHSPHAGANPGPIPGLSELEQPADPLSSSVLSPPLADGPNDRDASDAITEIPLQFNGEPFGSLFLAPFAEATLDPVVAQLAGHFVALALGSVRLSAQLAAELDEHEHDFTHDHLTGLANRVAFEQAVDAALTEVAGSMATAVPHGAALLVINLNRFKEVNTSFGHQVGDAVIAEVGSRLVRALGVDCAAARTGGDEFSVLLPNVHDIDHAVEQGQRLLRTLTGPIDTGEALIHIDAALGIAVAPHHGSTRNLLVRRADMAMDTAKDQPESTVRVWEPGQERVTQDQLELVVDLREAIEAGNLEVHYQPKTDLPSGAVVGVEALVRWAHPSRGFVSPEIIIPLAEHTGLIHDLTWFVMHTALADCSAWHRGGSPLHVAVNVPARSLRDPDLPDDVANALAMAELPGQFLTLEITETGFTEDNEVSRRVLEEIRKLGVRLSIDDFGTGYSALSYLSRLDVNELKIDKSFVHDMNHNPANMAIVRAVIDVADSFGLQTVAEGVENSEVLAVLAELGCSIAQGYFFSRPLSSADFVTWLSAHEQRVVADHTS
jgi:diguanylate cyclase